jgi:hypothetical protein
MYRLLSGKDYNVKGSSINSSTNEDTEWHSTVVQFKGLIKHENKMQINGYGYSIFREEEYPFILLGEYCVKTGIGNVTKQHIVQTHYHIHKNNNNNNMIKGSALGLGNHINYDLLILDPTCDETTGQLKQTNPIALFLYSDTASAVMSLTPSTTTKLNTQPKVYDLMSASSAYSPCDLTLFHLRHSYYTRCVPVHERLYAEIIYPQQGTAFYYRAGFKIGGWKTSDKTQTARANLLQKTSENTSALSNIGGAINPLLTSI